MKEAPFFNVEGLSKAFGGLKAIDELSFQVDPGMIYAIIGPNGAGKSTLFNCITGIYRPDAGAIHFEGRSLLSLRPDQIAALSIARTFQNLELFRHMSAFDNLLLGRHLHMRASLWQILGLPWPRSAAAREEVRHRRRVEEIIDFLDLASARNQLVSALPYGKQKMVELGRALAMEPRLLLLDEPAAGLNQEEREEMAFWIKDIRDKLGVTVILIEHNMQLVTQLAERVLALNFGRWLAEGTPGEVLHDAGVVEAYLGS
jgi:branched-chain amino acid transport system ATP-binding protein